MPAGRPHKRKKEFSAQVRGSKAVRRPNNSIENARTPGILRLRPDLPLKSSAVRQELCSDYKLRKAGRASASSS
jgi:hypothetical protein